MYDFGASSFSTNTTPLLLFFQFIRFIPKLVFEQHYNTFVCFLLCSKPISAHMNAHEAHMSASWAYIPIIWSHINAYLTHRGPYWPQMRSIRICIKAVLGLYGFLSGAFLDRYVPIWYYMKPYWCPVNSCWVPSGRLRIHSHIGSIGIHA